MKRSELAELIRRLRASDDSDMQTFAAELEAKYLPPRGRPLAPALKRVLARLRRAALAEAIFRGKGLPAAVDPEGVADGALPGSRLDADGAAAEILGDQGTRAIERARSQSVESKNGSLRLGRKEALTDPELWEELKALMKAATK